MKEVPIDEKGGARTDLWRNAKRSLPGGEGRRERKKSLYVEKGT